MNRKNNRKTKRKLNNEGSAIVLVIVVMALMGILVTTALYMCYANYQMKANDLQSKDNFYSAETVLEEIKAGLQEEASVATDIAYMNVIQNYEVYSMNPDARRDEFTFQYVSKLRKDLQAGTSDQHYDIDKLRAYVKNAKVVDDITSQTGAQIDVEKATVNGGTAVKNDMVAYSEALVLKNIIVKYKDEKGYVSIIKTDIRLAIPKISFESALQIPEIIGYSLIANNKLSAERESTISGSVYGGRDGIFAEGGKGLYFKDSELVITPNLVTASDNSEITVDENSNLWAGGAVVDKGATLSLLGNSYIKDDTTVTGNNSKLNIKGKYMGFSMVPQGEIDTANDKAENSSAIIINGTHSKVDLSGVKRLLLPGNAYIGVTTEVSTTPTPTTAPMVTGGVMTQDKDVRLGESLTAKASQIAYLIPSECIGYVKKSADTDYECVLGTNPVLYSKYKSDYEDASGDKIEVDFSRAGVDYEQKYGAKVQRKFVRTNNAAATNETLVYFYMTFPSKENAAKFFKDYFAENEERISQYLDIYIDTLKINDIERLNIAGNLLKKVTVTDEAGNVKKDEAGNEIMKYELVGETQTADSMAGMDYAEEIDIYQNVFKCLTTKLVKDDSGILAEDYDNVSDIPIVNADGTISRSKGIFANIIDMDVFDKIVNSTNEYGAKPYFTEFVNSVESVRAIVRKGDYTIGTETPNTTSLVIASGDVTITRHFEGTVIAGGDIIVEYGTSGHEVDINHNRELVRHVLNISNEFNLATGTKEKIAVKDLFKDGSSWNTTEEIAAKEDKIVIEDLITYENWSKE